VPHPGRQRRAACRAVIDDLFTINALFRLRSAQGILRLADKHGPARLEAACAKAITAEDPTYRTIRGILAAGAETEPAPAGTGDGGAPAHLHGPDVLFSNVINMPVRAPTSPDGWPDGRRISLPAARRRHRAVPDPPRLLHPHLRTLPLPPATTRAQPTRSTPQVLHTGLPRRRTPTPALN